MSAAGRHDSYSRLRLAGRNACSCGHFELPVRLRLGRQHSECVECTSVAVVVSRLTVVRTTDASRVGVAAFHVRAIRELAPMVQGGRQATFAVHGSGALEARDGFSCARNLISYGREIDALVSARDQRVPPLIRWLPFRCRRFPWASTRRLAAPPDSGRPHAWSPRWLTPGSSPLRSPPSSSVARRAYVQLRRPADRRGAGWSRSGRRGMSPRVPPGEDRPRDRGFVRRCAVVVARVSGVAAAPAARVARVLAWRRARRATSGAVARRCAALRRRCRGR